MRSPSPINAVRSPILFLLAGYNLDQLTISVPPFSRNRNGSCSPRCKVFLFCCGGSVQAYLSIASEVLEIFVKNVLVGSSGDCWVAWKYRGTVRQMLYDLNQRQNKQRVTGNRKEAEENWNRPSCTPSFRNFKEFYFLPFGTFIRLDLFLCN